MAKGPTRIPAKLTTGEFVQDFIKNPHDFTRIMSGGQPPQRAESKMMIERKYLTFFGGMRRKSHAKKIGDRPFLKQSKLMKAGLAPPQWARQKHLPELFEKAVWPLQDIEPQNPSVEPEVLYTRIPIGFATPFQVLSLNMDFKDPPLSDESGLESSSNESR